MTWFFKVFDSNKRLMSSKGGFATQKDALAASDKNVISIITQKGPSSISSVDIGVEEDGRPE